MLTALRNLCLYRPLYLPEQNTLINKIILLLANHKMAVMKGKASHRSAVSPIVGPSIEELPPGDLPSPRNVLAKAIWLKESTNQTNNNFTN